MKLDLLSGMDTNRHFYLTFILTLTDYFGKIHIRKYKTQFGTYNLSFTFIDLFNVQIFFLVLSTKLSEKQ